MPRVMVTSGGRSGMSFGCLGSVVAVPLGPPAGRCDRTRRAGSPGRWSASYSQWGSWRWPSIGSCSRSVRADGRGVTRCAPAGRDRHHRVLSRPTTGTESRLRNRRDFPEQSPRGRSPAGPGRRDRWGRRDLRGLGRSRRGQAEGAVGSDAEEAHARASGSSASSSWLDRRSTGRGSAVASVVERCECLLDGVEQPVHLVDRLLR